MALALIHFHYKEFVTSKLHYPSFFVFDCFFKEGKKSNILSKLSKFSLRLGRKGLFILRTASGNLFQLNVGRGFVKPMI